MEPVIRNQSCMRLLLGHGDQAARLNGLLDTLGGLARRMPLDDTWSNNHFRSRVYRVLCGFTAFANWGSWWNVI